MKRPAAPQFGGAAGFLGSERQPAKLLGNGQQRAAGPTALPVELHPIPQKPSQARSAGSGARGLASNLQNNLGSSHNCGRAPKGGTLSDAAGRGLAIHIGTGSGQPPYFGRNLPAWANSRPTSFSLLDRARPVFSFSPARKRENGGCIAQPSSWLKSSPPARASITPAPGSAPADNLP